MKKEDLRPVNIRIKQRKILNDTPDNDSNKTEIKKGFFHQWVKSVTENGDETFHALIELENGKLVHYNTDEISFSDR